MVSELRNVASDFFFVKKKLVRTVARDGRVDAFFSMSEYSVFPDYCEVTTVVVHHAIESLRVGPDVVCLVRFATV